LLFVAVDLGNRMTSTFTPLLVNKDVNALLWCRSKGAKRLAKYTLEDGLILIDTNSGYVIKVMRFEDRINIFTSSLLLVEPKKTKVWL